MPPPPAANTEVVLSPARAGSIYVDTSVQFLVATYNEDAAKVCVGRARVCVRAGLVEWAAHGCLIEAALGQRGQRTVHMLVLIANALAMHAWPQSRSLQLCHRPQPSSLALSLPTPSHPTHPHAHATPHLPHARASCRRWPPTLVPSCRLPCTVETLELLDSPWPLSPLP